MTYVMYRKNHPQVQLAKAIKIVSFWIDQGIHTYIRNQPMKTPAPSGAYIISYNIPSWPSCSSAEELASALPWPLGSSVFTTEGSEDALGLM